ncbi:hypothetical protein [Scytonema sp. UIC 10036]|uniref:hypothetical protein n=1 Tax=Scytonema sp. UIC 10036 TaxID=2304196 RepID=UPI00140F5FF0|nr:hypothetical protein [Scytonema sp. UIC 10036]
MSIDREFYCEFDVRSLNAYTSQDELAKYLGVHRTTIGRHHNRLKKFFQDYKEVTTDGYPLSRYQCWVISRVLKVSETFRDNTAVMKYILNNSSSLSKYQFKKQFPDCQ